MVLLQDSGDNLQEQQTTPETSHGQKNTATEDALCGSPSSSCMNDDEELMAAVQRIQRQAALSATVNPWCYQTPAATLPPSLLFGLQGIQVTSHHMTIKLSTDSK